ncbi:MAG: alanine--tRNA ligase, partial [Alistipes sp.]|nr:alanine--tRNA ligase [Alistipes sp.]
SDAERAALDGRELVNQGHHLVIEIWNLVFMQFNRKASGELELLPARHVDTGMGFERLCMVLQGKQSNYDTDVFQPTIMRIAQMAGKSYGVEPKADIAMRVIADHLRAISFSIADGQLPSNVKAGYVIRRILRRAVRYGYTYLGFNEPFLCRLVDGLVRQMGAQFPELIAQQELITKVITEEENAFLKTLATGITLLESVMNKAKAAGRTEISGSEAFLLYDTYGFPIDLTELIASENQMKVDDQAFAAELQQQKERSRNAAAVDTDDWVELLPIEQCQFVGYDQLSCDVRISRYRRVKTKNKTYYQLVFDQTPFYGNSGGQTGDRGFIENDEQRIAVTDTQKENGLIMQIVDQLPENLSGSFRAEVDGALRAASAGNHTATHLLHKALRQVLGTHVEQKGSLVCPEYLRFDFSHFQKVTPEQIREVERLVNADIRADEPLDERRECPIEQAQKLGAMMLFGEKYGDHVRVVRYGSSIELCGGTHVARTGNIGAFKILSESATSAGVRRIEAVTGEKVMDFTHHLEDMLLQIQQYLNTPSIAQGIKKLIEENADLNKQMEEHRKDRILQLISSIAPTLSEEEGITLFARQVNLLPEVIKGVAFGLKQQFPTLVFVIGSVVGEKATLTLMLGDQLVEQGVNASQIVREAAKEIQGGGGGQPFFATAGGKNPAGIEAAIAKAIELVKVKIANK